MFGKILGKIFMIIIMGIIIAVGTVGIFCGGLAASDGFLGGNDIFRGTIIASIGIGFIILATHIFIKHLCIFPFMKFIAVILFTILGGLGIFYGIMILFFEGNDRFFGIIFLILGIFYTFSAVKMIQQIKNEKLSKK